MNGAHNTQTLQTVLSRYDTVTLLQGSPIPSLGLRPLSAYTKSNYQIFLVTKGTRKSILKLQWRKDAADSRFSPMVFVHTILRNVKPEIKTIIPKIYSLSAEQPRYVEIEYLEKYKPLGHIDFVLAQPSPTLLKTILYALSLFHVRRDQIDSQKLVLSEIRNFDWYMKEVAKIEAITRKLTFLKEHVHTDFLEDILEKHEQMLRTSDYFVLNDRNPSNIFIYQNKVKVIDFDRSGWGSPAVDYSLLYVVLTPYPELVEILMDFLNSRYGTHPKFWFRFWVDTLFRLIAAIEFWYAYDRRKIPLLSSILTKSMVTLYAANTSPVYNDTIHL